MFRAWCVRCYHMQPPRHFLSENVYKYIWGFKDLGKEGCLGGQSSQYECLNQPTASLSLPFLFTPHPSFPVPRNMRAQKYCKINGIQPHIYTDLPAHKITSHKIILRQKSMTRDKGGHFLMLKGPIHQEDIVISNLMHWKNIASQYKIWQNYKNNLANPSS